LSAFFALLYLIPFMSRVPFAWVVDTTLFILWIALFGLFGNMYIKERAEGDSGVQRMKNAVWVDLVNALLVSPLAFKKRFWDGGKGRRGNGPRKEGERTPLV
jgi:hypothetical protein